MYKVWILLGFLASLVSCSAPIQPTDTVKVEAKSALDGIWVGSFDIRGRGPYDFHAIHVGERSTAVSNKAKAMCVGQVQLDDIYYYAKYNLYALDGSPFDYATITGELHDGHIASHFVTLNGGDTGALQMTYSSLYDQPSSLALVEGDWKFIDRDGLEVSMSIQNGEIIGADSDSCKYIGRLEVINPKYNAYNVILNISNCDSVNGEYQGLSYLDNTEHTILRLDVGNEAYGFHFDFSLNENQET